MSSDTTLRGVVRRAHLGMALMAMALAGSLLLVVGLVALRVHQQSNLQLMARSVAYTVEAAVVFKDAQVAERTLAYMLEHEGVAHAVVRDARGAEFARWRGGDSSWRERVGSALAHMTLLAPAVAPILYEGGNAGEVELHGDGQGLLNFLIAGLLALLGCLAVSGAVGLLLARRMLRDMVAPLQALAQVARAVRRDHAKGQRVPPARLAELRELGEDFNALLAELEDREALLQQKNKALTHLALHDSLTDLPNRANFERQLPLAIAHARDTSQSMALLFMDCDRFKLINDSLGHGAGDALLVEVARRLGRLVRSGDVAARLGGDEFAMILAAPTGQAEAQAMVARVVAAMREPLVLANGGVIQSSMSAGVVVYPQQGDSMESLLQGADAAMYEAKARQRRRATDRQVER